MLRSGSSRRWECSGRGGIPLWRWVLRGRRRLRLRICCWPLRGLLLWRPRRRERPRGNYRRRGSTRYGAHRFLRYLDSGLLADTACATPDKCHADGPCRPESDRSGCCDPGNCIPNGANGCQRAALLNSTCCGSRGNSPPGTIFQNALSM